MEILMVFGGFRQEKTKPIKPNFVRVSDGFVIVCTVMEETRAFPVSWNFV